MNSSPLTVPRRLNLAGVDDGLPTGPVVAADQLTKAIAAGAIQVITPAAMQELTRKLENPMPGLDGLSLQEAELQRARATYVEKGLTLVNNCHHVHVDTGAAYLPAWVHVLATEAPEQLELQKGVLGDAFRGYNGLEYKKTGAEITAAINARLPALEATSEATRSQLTLLLSTLRVQPDRVLERYEYRGFTLPAEDALLSVFSWRAREWPAEGASPDGLGVTTPVSETAATDGLNPVSQEEARVRQIYNDLVYAYLDQRGEVLMMGTIARNVDAATKYPLSFDQLQALGF